MTGVQTCALPICWLSLLEIDHPPLTALIREFFSNLSCHINDFNTVIRSWIRGEEFTITPRVVAEALGVLIVTDPVIPMMSHLLLMRSCHTSLDHLSSGVLILRSRLQRFLRPHIYFLELRVIPCGPFLISTPSLWNDVCFYMRLCLVLLSVFLTCSFIL